MEPETDAPAGEVPQRAPPEEGVTPNATPPAKKPRKPRPPKIAAKLATVTETSPTLGELRPSKEAQLPLEFWAGLMQTQMVVMAQRKSERYNGFRIT